MKPTPLSQIQQVVDGKLLTTLPASPPVISAISTDTRQLSAQSLFVALRGETHDGHNYLPQAAAAGAIVALVEEPPPIKIPNLHLIQVGNTRGALGRLGRFFRQQLNAKVVAVGGSNGKTGTKHLIDSVLSAKLRGTFSPKSFNNDIGVPMAIFPADANQDYLVLELGTNHHGEIRVLTHIALPDIAVITNCSAEHLEGLGDLAGVRREEASIIEGLNPHGLLIVNGDDPELLGLVRQFPKRITFGSGRNNDLFATDIACDEEGVRYRLNGKREVFIPLLGTHVAVNSLAAVAVGRAFDLPEDVIVRALARAHSPEMRLQLQRFRGIRVLNDAYNANPASMKAALQTLSDLDTPGRRIAILGNMRELGDATDEFHREIGRFISSCKMDLLVCIGDKAALIGEAAVGRGFASSHVALFPNSAAAAASVPQWLADGDLVLLKGSRAMKLEAIANALASPDYLRKAAS